MPSTAAIKSKYASLPDFLRNASSAEKKKIYNDVLRRATERQLAVLKEAEKQNKSS